MLELGIGGELDVDILVRIGSLFVRLQAVRRGGLVCVWLELLLARVQFLFSLFFLVSRFAGKLHTPCSISFFLVYDFEHVLDILVDNKRNT